MPPLFKLLSQLDHSNVNQAVKVRLIRSYSLHVRDDPNNVYSFECVFHDSEGVRIHASIKRILIPRFQNILREEHLFAIKNFVLANNNMQLKTSSGEYKMIFTPKTTVVELFDADFPRNVFDFKPYDNFDMWENIDDNLLVDVMGRLSSRSARQTREVQGRETTMLDITLQNLEGNVIPCTIWGHFADELANHVENHHGPIVVIMQMCRVKRFRGEVRLSNTFNVSNIIFTANVPEIEEFHRGLEHEGHVDIPVTNLIMLSTMNIRADLESSRDKILTLDRLIRVHEIDQFWVYCQVVAVEPMLGWFYVSCKKCFKKMATAGSTFYCVHCDLADSVGTLRYRVMVRVADNWGIASLILWVKDCVHLIGKSAAELQATSAGQGVPYAISKIVGLKALFKVNLKDFSTGVNLGPFPVMKMTCDVQLISQFSNINNVSTVDNEDRSDSDNVMAPIKRVNVKSIATEVSVGVKRNLLGAFFGNEEENVAKEGKTEVP